jgi:hydroxyacylglutathione hydrolase
MINDLKGKFIKKFANSMLLQITESVYVLSELGKVNIWIITGSEKCLLIDTGFGLSDLRGIIQELTDRPIIAVNTHIHPDHSNGNNQFEQIFCDRFDEPFSHDGVSAADIKKEICRDFFADLPVPPADMEKWEPGMGRDIRTLKDGDIIDLGNRSVCVIETPGHTLGSIALLDEQDRLLFSGDMVLTWQIWCHITNSTTVSVYYDSIQKMMKLKDKFDYLAPGHTIGDEFLLNKNILDIYESGVQSVLAGTIPLHDEATMFGQGKCALFSTGGIVFDPGRMF